jgi:hypothetical protein
MTLMQMGHEALIDSDAHKCIICGDSAIELHHWNGRAMTKNSRLESANDLIIVGVVPLCKTHHIDDLRGEAFIEWCKANGVNSLIIAAMTQAFYAIYRVR